MALRSTVPGIAWPAIPDAGTANLLALVWQLEQSQWWPADRIAAAQHAQRDLLFAHAAASVPVYAGLKTWADVPILTRDRAIAAGDDLLTRAYPTPHGPPAEIMTSRTTGAAVTLRATSVTAQLWNAITLREHAWHRRDLSAKLAAIRHVPVGEGAPPDGARLRGWGMATRILAPDAETALLSIRSTTAQQVAWLVRENPTYLMVFPTILEGICRTLAKSGEKLPRLKAVRTTSEMMPAGIRELVREVLGVGIEDVYSAEECGYIALQCPGTEHYHVMSERLIVEIVRADGTACDVGETGRVVVTDLHNFATPLLRYELGDLAERGGPCACGRGLPTIARIRGRFRNLLHYPDGRTAWPVFTISTRTAAHYHELQLVQPTVDALVVRVVPEPGLELTARDRGAVTAALHGALGHPFAVTFEIVDELSRSPGGKLEEFISHVRTP